MNAGFKTGIFLGVGLWLMAWAGAQTPSRAQTLWGIESKEDAAAFSTATSNAKSNGLTANPQAMMPPGKDGINQGSRYQNEQIEVEVFPIVSIEKLSKTIDFQTNKNTDLITFWTAISLKHAPHWHSYWINPGDTGLATQLKWEMPKGISARTIQWPLPKRIAIGKLVNIGYENTALVPAPLQISRAGIEKLPTTFVLQLQLQWLICKEVCIPQQATLTLPSSRKIWQDLLENKASSKENALYALKIKEAFVNIPVDIAQNSTFSIEKAVANSNETTSTRAQTAKNGEVNLVLQVKNLPEQWKGKSLDLLSEMPNVLPTAIGSNIWKQEWVGNNGDVWQATLPLSINRGILENPEPDSLYFVIGEMGIFDKNKFNSSNNFIERASKDALRAAIPAQAVRIQAQLTGSWQAAREDQAVFQPGVSVQLQAALNANSAKQKVENTANGQGQSIGWLFILAFMGGIILNVMPCVLPVLTIKLVHLAQLNISNRQRQSRAWAYAAGVVLSFLLLAALLLILRTAGEQIGWGFQLQSPFMVLFLIVLFTLLAMNLWGFFDINRLVPSAWLNVTGKGPVWDAFLSGVLAVVIASPCTAPFMGASIGAALTMPFAQALFIFLGLGLGMAMPFVLLTFLPNALRFLPKAGHWMHNLKQALAIPLLLTVVWLLWVLGLQTNLLSVIAVLVLLIVLWMLVWVLTMNAVKQRTLWMGFVVLVAVVFSLVLFYVTKQIASIDSINTENDIKKLDNTVVSEKVSSINHWQPWSEQLQTKYIKEGRTVFVDYTAAWCVTCQINKQTTLTNAQVLQAFSDKGVVLLRADWTKRDAVIARSLQSLGRSGIPVYVLLKPNTPAVVLSEIITPQKILQILE